MEYKIGEIFEYNGEWYQAVEKTEKSCKACYFYSDEGCFASTGLGRCRHYSRSDNKSVIFKKLEKVGEPYELYGYLFQSYRTFEVPIFTENYTAVRELGNNSKISIEIKQTKEDMEEKKLNLKPFDLQKAKEGKPVCTRDGRKARVICFDRDWDMHIVALVADPLGESVHYYLSNGKVDSDKQNDEDLMMLPENKEGSMITETFVKNDRKDNKVMMELLPWPELEEIAKVYTAGAKKYGPNRWQNLPDGYQRYKGAMLRHLTEHEKGNLIDSETGCYHIAQCAWNAIAMLHFVLEEVKRIENEKRD